MVDTLLTLELLSHVIMDTPDLDPAQELVRHLETGIKDLQDAL